MIKKEYHKKNSSFKKHKEHVSPKIKYSKSEFGRKDGKTKNLSEIYDELRNDDFEYEHTKQKMLKANRINDLLDKLKLYDNMRWLAIMDIVNIDRSEVSAIFAGVSDLLDTEVYSKIIRGLENYRK